MPVGQDLHPQAVTQGDGFHVGRQPATGRAGSVVRSGGGQALLLQLLHDAGDINP